MTIENNMAQVYNRLSTLYPQQAAELTGQSRAEARNDVRAQAYTTLVAGLSRYSESWNATLRASPAPIDTSPAQNVLKAVEPLLNSLQLSTGKPLPPDKEGHYSDKEIYDYVTYSLDQMQTNYMDVYAQVTEQYQLFMQDVNSFKSSIAQYMTAEDDTVDLAMSSIEAELKKVSDKWSVTPILEVDNEADALYWQDQLGLPFVENGGTYSFYVNLQPITDMQEAIDALPDDGVLSTARFNQWQNSINSSCSTVESDTQIIAQKYSQANTIFNNLAKILSSTMDALYQTDKEFLRN
nr:IpaD/SipD/SspD family type III secretion system needle tip protein [uncultured Enterobacter sp.]